MISLKILFWLLAGHWFADFVLQTDKQAKGKSKFWVEVKDFKNANSGNTVRVWISNNP